MKKIVLALAVLLSAISLSAQSYKVIVNNGNSVSSLTKDEISKMMFKKTPKWPDGTKVLPVDLNKSDVRNSFSDEVLGKSVGSVKAYWQQYVFSGKGTPPVEKKTDAEVIAFVKSNSGAIGYVSSGADLSGVKEITIN